MTPELSAWAAELNRLGALRQPCAFLVDFECHKPRIFSQPRDDFYLRFAHSPPFFPIAPVKAQVNVDKVAFMNLKPPELKCFTDACQILQEGMHKGNSWLANLCFATPLELNFIAKQASELSLLNLCRQLEAPCLVWHQEPNGCQFVSYSPESFVDIVGTTISTRPMKGTRAVLPGETEAMAIASLMADPKEAAEHTTVVDLLRNDLGMIAQSVRVPQYRYATVIPNNQSTLVSTSSLIEGTLAAEWPECLGTLLATMLPAGSVSGAPKIASCGLIRQAELGDRGYYTGIAGYFDGATVRSYVLIRYLEHDSHGYRYRSGVGLTIYSKPLDEYAELIAKIYLPPLGNFDDT